MTKKATSKKILATRQTLRDALLGHAPKPQTKLLQLFGQTIELHQPTLRSIVEMQDTADTKTRAVDMIIDYAYVPGTNDLIFESTDREVILNWPFGGDLLKIQEAIADLTGVDVASAEEELKSTPLSKQS